MGRQAVTILVLLLAVAVILPATQITFNSSDFIQTPSWTTGPGSIYPSSINVSGFTSNTVSVLLTLGSLTEPKLGDIQIILVAPTGQAVEIMDLAGVGFGVNMCTLSFSSYGVSGFGLTQPVCGGNYLPGNGTNASLPGPAPGGPYATSFSVFNNLDPNGVWKLYINDKYPDAGGYLHTWSLTITDAKIPEPGTWGLLALGLTGLVFMARRRRTAQ